MAVALGALTAFASGGAPAAADDLRRASWIDNWLAQPQLTGNWFGARDALAGWGITPSIRYATDVQGSVLGGRRRGTAYAGELLVDVGLDLKKLAGLTGLTFHVSGDWASGTNLSNDIGNVFDVAQYFEGRGVRLYTLFFQESLFDGRLDIKVGRFGTGDDFLTTPADLSLVNGALNPMILAIQANVPSVTDEPHSTWGGRVSVWPTATLSLSAGAYYSDPTFDELRTNGTEFAISDRNGYFVIGEAAYYVNDGKFAAGLPGRYRVGGYYDSNHYTSLSNPSQGETGNYGFYFLGEQMVYREGKAGGAQGLSLFWGLVYAPLQRINTLPWFGSAALSYRGLIPGRDKDTAAFALYYGGFSRDLPGQTYELVLEWTYAIALTRWLTIQPDVQYVINPGGRSSVGNAVVVGAQLAVEF
ncbi:MAG TPA: carbohydrate porin [Methylomirabilota bacterium]|nr:carbohydrate porin [Methylomirabilota bacterium]